MNFRTCFVLGLALVFQLAFVAGPAKAEPRLEPRPKLAVKTPRFKKALALPDGFQGIRLDSDGQALGSQAGPVPMGPSYAVVYDLTGKLPIQKWTLAFQSTFVGSNGGNRFLGIDFSDMEGRSFMLQTPVTPNSPVGFTNLRQGVSTINRHSTFGGTDWSTTSPRPFRLRSALGEPDYAPIESSVLQFLGDNNAAVIGQMIPEGVGPSLLWLPDNSLIPLTDGYPQDMSPDGTIVAGATSRGATLWINGEERNLALGLNSNALRVNSNGDTIVTIANNNGLEVTTFLLREGKLFNLAKLARLPKGWHVSYVIDINDRSEIMFVAYRGKPGAMNSKFRTFVLKPR